MSAKSLKQWGQTIGLWALFSLLSACWYGPDNNPKAVTLKFLEMIRQGKYDLAMGLAGDDYKLLVNMEKMAFAGLSPSQQRQELANRAKQVIAITDFDEAKETARVYVRYDRLPAEAMNLIKKNGRWLIGGW